MNISKFFKDKRGHWAIVHFPNALLSAWIVLLIANFLLHNQHVRLLQSAVLFAWAYLELTQGTSYFRKTLGAIILLAITVGFFVS